MTEMNDHIRRASSRPTGPPPDPRLPGGHAEMNRLLRRQPVAGLNDPDDAEVYLDPATWTDDAGQVDEDARAQAVAELIEAKPYLAGEAPPPPPEPPRVPAGARGTETHPTPNMSDLIRGQVTARRRDIDVEVDALMHQRLTPGNDAA